MHIPQTFSNRRQIPGGGTTIAEYNPCVIICRFSATKIVRHNQETNTPPWNCQVLHIGCICVLPDAPSDRPNPRVLRSNIVTITETTKGIQNAGPNNETSEIYTSKASPPYLQANKPTSEHSHRPTDHRRIFLRYAVLRVLYNSLKGVQTHTHPSERGYTFYRKRRELSHDSGILHLANKVSMIFRTQENGINNATVTQWRTSTTLCPVCIWA